MEIEKGVIVKILSKKKAVNIGILGSVASIVGVLIVFFPEAENGMSSSISLGDNTTIITHSGGRTVIRSANNKNIISNETIKQIKNLGVAENAIQNFLVALKKNEIPINKWDNVLQDIAKKHLELKRKIKEEVLIKKYNNSLPEKIQSSIENLDYDKAERLIKKSIEKGDLRSKEYLNKINLLKINYIQEKTSLSNNYASIGDISTIQFNFKKGIKNYKKSVLILKDLENDFDVKNKEKLSILYYEIASAIYKIGNPSNYKEANNFLLQSIRISGDNNKLKTSSYLLLSIISISLDKVKKANSYLKESEKYIELSMYSDLELASIYNQLGIRNYYLDNIDKAYIIFMKSKGLYEKNDAKTIGYAVLLGDIGTYYFHKNEMKKSKKIMQESVDILRKEVGNNSPILAPNISNLAEVYRVNKKYKKAIILYKESIQIIKNSKGKTHPDLINPYNGVSHVFLITGDCYNTEKFYKKIMELKKINNINYMDYPEMSMLLENQVYCYKEKNNRSKVLSTYKVFFVYMDSKKGKMDILYEDRIKYLTDYEEFKE